MSSEQENNDLSREEINTGTDATPHKRASKKAAKMITNVDHHVESDEVTFSSDIKVDKLIKISVKSIESIQSKSAKVLAEIRFTDKKKNIIEKFPLESEFWFRNRFLEYDGDKRVLTKEQIKLSKNRFMPFPPDEVLIFNNSENIKRKMKRIIYKSFN